MHKRRDLLERLSDDDPNYEVAKRFHLRAWADSHGLVADGLSGQVSLDDFVRGCVRTFDQGAQAHVAFKDATSVTEKCRALDDLAKKSIRLFKKKLTPESKRLGKTAIRTAIDEFCDRVAEIAARSKQRILEEELDQITVGQKVGAAAISAELDAVPPSGNSSQAGAEGAMAGPPSWKDLRAEFQKYADQYADRAEREPPADWAQLPQGPWIIHGGSPRSHRLFKEIAAQAVARRGISCHPGDKEPWQLWLDFLWTEGWHRPDASGSGAAANRPRRVSYHEYKILAEDETQRIHRIFQTSADCCADFEERDDKSERPASETLDTDVGPSPEPLKRSDQEIDPASEPECEIRSALVRDGHVDLLEKIVAKKNITIEAWASEHKVSRTVLFDWKSARESGKSLKGKVSDTKSVEIETAIMNDAKALGLVTRTGSD